MSSIQKDIFLLTHQDIKVFCEMLNEYRNPHQVSNWHDTHVVSMEDPLPPKTPRLDASPCANSQVEIRRAIPKELSRVTKCVVS